MQELDRRARMLLTGVREDHQSGATQLARRILHQLLAYVDESTPSAAALAHLIEELRTARPSMVVIGNSLELVRQRWAEAPEQRRQPILEALRQLGSASAEIVRHARARLPANPVIMTHSASSVALALFRQMAEAGQPFAVICTQSSPGFEGHNLARALNDLAIPVTLITDAQMGLFVDKADVIITGCDTWLADGHFINKSGTRLLALAAKAAAKPFWVLADSFRNSDSSHTSVNLEEMPVSELNGPQGTWITPRNIYFETIPEQLVSVRISEQGVFSCPAGPRR